MKVRTKRIAGVVSAGLLAVGLAVSPSFAESGTEAGHEEPAGHEDHQPSPEEFAAVERDLDAWAKANPEKAAASSIVTVPVYVHVFYDRDNNKGYISAKEIWAQLRWLNHSFSGGQGGASTRFRFELKSYDRVSLEDHTIKFDSRYEPTERTKRLMRNHRSGGKGTLNIWTGDLSGSLLGIARFPWWQARYPERDGVWVQADTWRNKPVGMDCRDQGDLAVHEIGHWLGLKHKSTEPYCGGQSNFMSYGKDATRVKFDGDQAQKMSRMWNRYRG